MKFSACSNIEKEYKLAHRGTVRFADKDVQSVMPWYENTKVILNNGQSYLLKGRNYGV